MGETMSVTRHNRTRRAQVAGGVIAGVVALAASACGSSTGSSAQGAASPSASHHPMASHSPMAHPAVFGADCGMVPATGMGSLHGMSMDPVVTGASHNPLLSTFAADATKAGLSSDLNSMAGLTVFAPANTAFAKLSHHTMTMLASRSELAKILKYHVVEGRITPAELAGGKELKTLEGDTLKPSRMGAVYEVNNAHVICGNIQTENATVYVIDAVLMPMH